MTAPSPSPSPSLNHSPASNTAKPRSKLVLVAQTALAVAGLTTTLTSCDPTPSLQKSTMESFEKQGDLLAQITKKAKEAPNKAGGNAFTNVYDYLRESAGCWDNMGKKNEDSVTFTHEDVSYTISTRQRKDGIQEFSIVWTSGLSNKRKQKVEGKQIYTLVDGEIRVKENDRPERVLTDHEFQELSAF